MLKKIKEKCSLFKSKVQTIGDLKDKGYKPLGVIKQYIEKGNIAVTVVLVKTEKTKKPYGMVLGSYSIEGKRLLDNNVRKLGASTEKEAVEECYKLLSK